jgi:putative ATP-dependent endonuclease of the OLD family
LWGGNGSGKTAIFQALSRLFGVTKNQRTIQVSDFHLAEVEEIKPGATLSIDAVFCFPELDGLDDKAIEDAVPEYFLQMAASEPGGPLKVRMKLKAKWIDDGTPEGTVEEDLRWVHTISGTYSWDDCTKVQALERGSIQLIYVPANRDASAQVGSLLNGRLWQAAKWSDKFRKSSAKSAKLIQKRFEAEEPAKFVLERLSHRWNQVYEGDTDTTPVLRLVEKRFAELVKRATFAFHPDEAGQERELISLSDGQQSLFHIVLTAATLEVERDAFSSAPDETVFDQAKVKRVCLTILAIEEPENCLSPFFLSRIILQAREIGALTSAQVILSSHSAAILSPD